jgi:hypothetical protein
LQELQWFVLLEVLELLLLLELLVQQVVARLELQRALELVEWLGQQEKLPNKRDLALMNNPKAALNFSSHLLHAVPS